VVLFWLAVGAVLRLARRGPELAEETAPVVPEQEGVAGDPEDDPGDQVASGSPGAGAEEVG
jgi:hypothetical protein